VERNSQELPSFNWERFDPQTSC